MKNLILFIIFMTGLLLLSRCSNTANATPTPENMICQPQNGTNFNIERCENSEAVCLITEQGGISCKWK